MDKNTIKEPKELSHPVDLNGELISIQEIKKRYFQCIKHRQEKWLNKACEYLESAIRPYMGYSATCDFVDAFRKVMNEQP